MKFLSVAVAGTMSTFIIGGTALPLPASTLNNPTVPNTNLPESNLPPFHIGIPDPVPENCGLHCPAIAKRSSTLEPIDDISYLATRHMGPGGFGGAPGGGPQGGAPASGFGGPRILPRFGGGPSGHGAPNGGFGGQGGFSGPSRIFPRFGFGGMGGHGGPPGGAPGGFGGSPGGFGHGMMKRFINTAICARSYLTGGCCGVCPVKPIVQSPAILEAPTPVPTPPATPTTPAQ